MFVTTITYMVDCLLQIFTRIVVYSDARYATLYVMFEPEISHLPAEVHQRPMNIRSCCPLIKWEKATVFDIKPTQYFNPYRTNGIFHKATYKNIEKLCCIYQGVKGYSSPKHCISFSEDLFLFWETVQTDGFLDLKGLMSEW